MAKKKSFRPGRGEVERLPETIVLRRRPLGALRLTAGQIVKIPAREIPEPAPLVLQTESASREYARGLFLDAVSSVEPLVLEQLSQLRDQIRHLHIISWEWELVNADARLVRLRKGLKQWGQRWHLSDPWCLDWASQTIGSRQQNPSSASWFHNALVYRGNIDVPRFHFHYTALPWQPFGETWEEYKKYVKSMANAVLEIQLEGHNPTPDLTSCWPREAMRRKAEAEKLRLLGYRAEIQRLIGTEGLRTTREKRQRDHFFWLARRQVKGEAVSARPMFGDTESRALAKSCGDSEALLDGACDFPVLGCPRSCPRVRIDCPPPPSLRFERFSGEVRKLRACRAMCQHHRADRKEHDDELAAGIARVFSSRPAPEWECSLTAAGVACVQADVGVGDFLEKHPHAIANQLEVEVESPRYGKYLRHGAIVNFSDAPARLGYGAFGRRTYEAYLARIGIYR